MFFILLRWVRGLILGWVLALLFSLVKRMLARVFELNMPPPRHDPPVQRPQGTPQTAPQATTNQQAFHAPVIIDTIWAGMSVTELESIFGPPDKKLSGQDGLATWVYNAISGMNGPTDITIANGLIRHWTTHDAPPNINSL